MKNLGEKIQSFLIVAVVLFIIISAFSCGNMGKSSPEYQEEQQMAYEDEVMES